MNANPRKSKSNRRREKPKQSIEFDALSHRDANGEAAIFLKVQSGGEAAAKGEVKNQNDAKIKSDGQAHFFDYEIVSCKSYKTILQIDAKCIKFI